MFGSPRLNLEVSDAVLDVVLIGCEGPISNPSFRLSVASSGCVGKYLCRLE